MLAKVISCAIVGLEGAVVEVEVDISPGLPSFTIVGLPDAAVQEARERVRAAIRNSGCNFPTRRIVVNLAPADLKKAGPAYDLPIAVGTCRRVGNEYAFEIEVGRIIEPKEWTEKDKPLDWLTQEYNAALEELIRKDPTQYWWLHRRWKTRPKEERKAAPKSR